MTMASSAPLASNRESTDEKNDVEIGISRVELVLVAGSKIGNGQWWKKLIN